MAELSPDGDMSKMLERLMADEKFGELLNSVKESISASADNASEKTAPSEKSVQAESPISAIPKLSPELMSKLPEIMGMLSGSGGSTDSKMADRKRLLSALKPFLSDKRKNAVDSIVNIAGIADLFGI